MDNIFTSEKIKISSKKIQKTIIDFCKNKNLAICIQELQKLKHDDVCEQIIFELLMSHLLQAEAIAAGGLEGFIAFLSNEEVVPTQLKKFDKSSIKKLLSTFLEDEHTVEMIDDCLQYAGLHGKIVLSQHPVNGDDDIVELVKGSFFSDLIPAFNLKSTKFLNPRLICVDGFVESVSEIHRLLEDASSSKETIILFVRGLSDEVLRTLKINYDRGSLRLVPIIVKYDIENANLLNDIATINCSDVVSTHKGELISNIDLNKFFRVDSVDITTSGIGIENQATSALVDLHIKKLQEKIINSDNQYEKDVATKRLQNLGMNRITIRLKETSNKKQKNFMIDRSLRAVKDARTFGICDLNSKTFPYSGIKSGMFYASKFLQSINEIETIIAD